MKKKLNIDDIEAVISNEDYHYFENTTVTVCLLTLKNGFSVLGKSACVSLDEFNHEIGKKIAREDAVEKIWELEGYLLKQAIFESSNG